MCLAFDGVPDEVGDEVEDGNGQEHAPANPHDLVIAEARNRPANPDEEEEESAEFEEEPSHAEEGCDEAVAHGRYARCEMPAAQEHHDEQRRADDHVAVFGDEEEAELERAVFGVEAADEVSLGLRHVEGVAIGFREDTDEEDQRGNRVVEEIPDALLGVHHRDEAQGVVLVGRGGGEEDRQHGQAHREFIRDELGRTADSAEEGVLRVGGPPGERDAVDAERADREHEEHTDVGARTERDDFAGR